MTKFCNCNSKWDISQVNDKKFRWQSGAYSDEYLGACEVCGFYYWHEPHYENMMHDLRNMNLC